MVSACTGCATAPLQVQCLQNYTMRPKFFGDIEAGSPDDIDGLDFY